MGRHTGRAVAMVVASNAQARLTTARDRTADINLPLGLKTSFSDSSITSAGCCLGCILGPIRRFYEQILHKAYYFILVHIVEVITKSGAMLEIYRGTDFVHLAIYGRLLLRACNQSVARLSMQPSLQHWVR